MIRGFTAEIAMWVSLASIDHAPSCIVARMLWAQAAAVNPADSCGRVISGQKLLYRLGSRTDDLVAAQVTASYLERLPPSLPLHVAKNSRIPQVGEGHLDDGGDL